MCDEKRSVLSERLIMLMSDGVQTHIFFFPPSSQTDLQLLRPFKPPQFVIFLSDQWEVSVTQHVSAVKSSDLPVCHIKGLLTFSAVL